MFDTFCTDLIALFANHILGCDDCFNKSFGSLLIIFVVIGLIFLVIDFVGSLMYKLLSKLFDRFRYKKGYDDLLSDYVDLEVKFLNLREDYCRLKSDFSTLQKEYYHTCN